MIIKRRIYQTQSDHEPSFPLTNLPSERVLQKKSLQVIVVNWRQAADQCHCARCRSLVDIANQIKIIWT
jgi:hypothetical protein